MLLLFLTVCLLGEPSRCKVEQVPFVAYAAAEGCLAEGQLKAAEYIQRHPGWFVVRYECGAPKT